MIHSLIQLLKATLYMQACLYICRKYYMRLLTVCGIFMPVFHFHASFSFPLSSFSVLEFPTIHSYYFYNKMINHQMLINAPCVWLFCDSILLRVVSICWTDCPQALQEGVQSRAGLRFSLEMSTGFIVEGLMCLHSHVSSWSHGQHRGTHRKLVCDPGAKEPFSCNLVSCDHHCLAE